MKLITVETLQYFKKKLDGLFVKKELKTGSTSEYKVLSDHNLTDELVEKINNAGVATEVTENIATAKSEAILEAKSYTDAEVADALAEAKSYADAAEADAVASAKAYTDETAATAKSEAIAESNTYTDAEVSEALAEAKSYTDTEVAEALAEAKSYADTSEADAVAAAKTYTDEKAATTKSEAVSEAKSYTDNAKTAANGYTDAQVSAAKTELTTAIGTVKTEANAYTDSQVSAAKSELTTAINSKISTAYKVKGSTTFSNFPALSEAEEGNVYNVTDAFTSTANFVEGAGKKYPAGSNVVCVEVSEGVFKWDVLAGFIDTDVFVRTSDIETVTESDIDAMFVM